MDLEYQKKIDDMHNALVGNPLTNDGGLIAEIKEIKQTAKQNADFIARLKWSGGIIVSISAFFGYLTDKLISLFTNNH